MESLRLQVYQFITYKMGFFDETEAWDRTNEVFNPDMCKILRDLHNKQSPPSFRAKIKFFANVARSAEACS